MELVEGPTLADRIAQGSVPVDEVLRIARQIADALEAAHEQGIIHRDLKPANIKLRPDGIVKVLDFGLAKAIAPAAATSSNQSRSPTITSPALMTTAGMLLGTATYMSPEQAKGKQADRRSDIWAFGCVLYEMLTGSRAFDGGDITETIAAVVKDTPDWSRLPADTPPSMRRVLRRCLTKEHRRRLADIADGRLELEESESVSQDTKSAGTTSRRERLVWAGVVGTLAAALALTAVRAFQTPMAPPEIRLDLVPPASMQTDWVALSPDGTRIAFVVVQDGIGRIAIRSLEDGSTQVFAGTDGALSPFWSPDSRALAFGGRPGLRRLDLADGAVRTLAPNEYGANGGTWNRDDVILFASTAVSSLMRISATRPEKVVPVTTLRDKEIGHVRPRFLTDGRHFLYVVRSATVEASGVYVVSLDGDEPRRLVSGDAAMVVANHLLFVRQNVIFAQPFDEDRLELSGEPFRVTETGDVRAPSGDLTTPVSVSATGAIAFLASFGAPNNALVWFDRTGREIQRLNPPAPAGNNPVLSPDGRYVAVSLRSAGNADIWTFDLVRGVWARITSGLDPETQPVWSPDGRQLAYFTVRGQNAAFYRKPAVSGGSEDGILESPGIKKLEDWSPDGRYLAYSSPRAGTAGIQDSWIVPVDGDRKPRLLVQTDFTAINGQFSPDGHSFAYESNDSGRFEVYVQPYPGPGERIQISTNGGAQARWRRDGKELYYIGLDQQLMAVPITRNPEAHTLEAGKAVPLFFVRISGGPVSAGGNRQQYAVSPDGERFLINTATTQNSAPITLILNWNPRRGRD